LHFAIAFAFAPLQFIQPLGQFVRCQYSLHRSLNAVLGEHIRRITQAHLRGWIGSHNL
jgi:hypothetical protein